MARPTDKEAKKLGYTSISIRVDPETIDKLNLYCKDKGLVRSEFIRALILKAVKG